ncbi:D-alanine--D-alanine ligase [Myxococcota bacterium]|nr:D-alanine--D-alanine ligase [Myxococcota bacterium]
MSELQIGIVYDLLGTHPREPSEPPDAGAEYEPEATLVVIERSMARLGHRCLRIGNPQALLQWVAAGQAERVAAACNISEGWGTRNREAWAPVLLEMAGVPTLGSDALTLSATLDKAWAHAIARRAGISVAAQACVNSRDEALELDLPAAFPLFVKPRWEGTAKGIRESSRVEDRAALADEVERVVGDYGQPALVEEFIGGPEYTVAVVGHDPPRALPVLQRALEVDSRIGLHALETGAATEGREFSHCLPGTLSPAVEAQISDLGIRAHRAFDCLDFSRSDFRLDSRGKPRFLEINPLPTFAEDGSFGVVAELEGRSIDALLADVFALGFERLGVT